MKDSDFDCIKISLASPQEVKRWSYGEVTKPETINYRTLKPERYGLFCERIFGPVKDFECHCGKYKKVRYKGVICDRCGVEVTWSRVRRERIGHIELACPVAHIWFFRGSPNYLSLLLDISPRNLERVIYFSQYIITWVDEKERERLENMGDEEVVNIRPLALITEGRYQELRGKYGNLFKVGMGAETILEILQGLNLQRLQHELLAELESSSFQRRKRASKRLGVVRAFLNSGNKPEWMILTVLPVLPPDLRPMIQLDGGRFTSSDINDLYRRIINRNNRLKHLLELDAPGIIIRNEKRMLQEAVDSLIDNGRRGRAVTSGNRPLKSLSELLRGKQGRFRQNLLGKRVDYSGRSVITTNPKLCLHQCGLPRRMALELYKPFIISRLIQKGITSNIKTAKRVTERARPEAYEVLEEVVKDRPVLLNRAPTLHRLSIQAFEPVLTNSSAIQLHPLACAAFNADFDGDQMAVHLPLSQKAVEEARGTLLSTQNLILPSNGEPVALPTLDMVLGCYYLTIQRPGANGEGKVFRNFDEARLAYELGALDLQASILIKGKEEDINTTAGRIIFNEALPENVGFQNQVMDKSSLKRIVAQCIDTLSKDEAEKVLDDIKRLGFQFATKSGTTIAMSDIKTPSNKADILAEADKRVAEIETQCQEGIITADERHTEIVRVWSQATDNVTSSLQNSLDPYGGVYMMANSGAKGNISQIRQMGGMRGLMINPAGRIIDLPIKSSLGEGLSVLEYFISTHGARKGLSDTALRTSDSGYLTRRLVDVAQDVIVLEEDCGTTEGRWLYALNDPLLPPFSERMMGRTAARKIYHPETSELIVDQGEEITEEVAQEIASAHINKVYVRSPLGCKSKHGICQKCYGRDLATKKLVNLKTAVGVIAAQSIGEPGTQLTLRTFHTGGIAGEADITSGLPRVEELFEARLPKSCALVAENDGIAHVFPDSIRILPMGEEGREYPVPSGTEVVVKEGNEVVAGDRLTQGLLNPQDILHIQGREKVERYLIDEVQRTYRSQGVSINDKHIEIIMQQMFSRVKIESPGNTPFLPQEMVSRSLVEETNSEIMAEGGEPALVSNIILGITEASLLSDSFLAAASFQETTCVLTQAAVEGKVDRLFGLKENVIIGRLIPARCLSK
jgi:DNA-directed RNA polymerase subunit beta'